jgi:hypothetical protein
MILRIAGITIGVLAIIVMAATAPDIKRYMRIRCM